MNDDKQQENDQLNDHGLNNQGATRPSQPNDPAQELQSKCEEYLNGWRRAKADYANLQKETEEFRKSFGSYIVAQTVSEVIPIIDHWDEAMKHMPQEIKGSSWAVGMEHIRRQIDEWLRGKGVEPMEVLGKPFDPANHEAVEKRTDPEHANVVIEVMQKGYCAHGKVLRPAKVIIGE